MSEIGKESLKDDHVQRTGNQQRQPEIIDMEIISVSNATPTVKELVLLTTEKPVPVSFKAGQWVDMIIPGVDTVGGYSICSTPTHLSETGELTLCVKYSDHPPAHWVHNECKPGSRVSIRIGGDFFLDINKERMTDKNILLVAGGVGINPIFSIISTLLDREKSIGSCDAKYCLMYSVKTKDELLFKDSLDKFAMQDHRFSVQYFLTQNDGEVNTFPQEDVKLGRITKADVESCLASSLCLDMGTEEANKKPIVYLCGPPPMIQDVQEMFSSLGIDTVFYEKWW